MKAIQRDTMTGPLSDFFGVRRSVIKAAPYQWAMERLARPSFYSVPDSIYETMWDMVRSAYRSEP